MSDAILYAQRGAAWRMRRKETGCVEVDERSGRRETRARGRDPLSVSHCRVGAAEGLGEQPLPQDDYKEEAS